MKADRLPAARDVSLEELFTSQYDWLLGWANHFTRGQQEQPEDLVHDLFIQVLRTSPQFDTEENAKAYLYRSLRNLSYASVTRRTRIHLQQISLCEYDSVQFAIAGADRSSLLWIRDDLWKICRYVCRRKSVLRAASYFILRFFLDYSPSEIMALAGASRAVLDKSIQLMREELRSHLAGSGPVVMMQKKDLPAPPPAPSDTVRDLFQQFSSYIASCAEGDCLSSDAIEEISAGGAVDTATLAHLVSCELCRERCPRFPGGNRPAAGKGSERAPRRDTAAQPIALRKFDAKAFSRRLRRNFEHRPRYLYLTVAGNTEASQRVTSPTSELGATVISRDSSVYIEVTSEQGVRLLSLLFEDDYRRSPCEATAEAELSDGRSLRLEVFPCGSALTVRVVYRDPVIEQMRELEAEQTAPVPAALQAEAGYQPAPHRNPLKRLRSFVAGIYWPPVVVASTVPLLLAIMVAPSWLTSHRRSQALTELAEIEQSQQTLLKLHDLHRVGLMETHDSAHGIRKERIEVWRSGATHQVAVRLYRSGGKLAESYLSGGGQAPSSACRDDANADGGADCVWKAGFDPELAETLLRQGGTGRVTVQGSTERIEAQANRSHPAAGLVEAVLVLSLPSRGIVEQDYVIQTGAGQERVRLIETEETVLQRGEIPSSVFTREPEGDGNRRTQSAPLQYRPHLSTTVLAARQIDALWAVQAVNPRPEEAIEVHRGGHTVRVTGVVSTAARRKAIVQAIRSECPACLTDIDIAGSGRQALRRFRRARGVVVQDADLAGTLSPAERLLKGAPQMQGLSIAVLRAQTTQVAAQLFDESSALVRHSHALRMIASCCSEAEIEKLPRAQQMKWLEMMHHQLRLISASLASAKSGIDVVSGRAGIPQPVLDPVGGTEQNPALDETGLKEINQLHAAAVDFRLSLQGFFSSLEGPDDNPEKMWQQLCLQAQQLDAQVREVRSLIPASRKTQQPDKPN